MGFILGPLMEEHLRRALQLSRGDLSAVFNSPVSTLCIVLTVSLIGGAIAQQISPRAPNATPVGMSSRGAHSSMEDKAFRDFRRLLGAFKCRVKPWRPPKALLPSSDAWRSRTGRSLSRRPSRLDWLAKATMLIAACVIPRTSTTGTAIVLTTFCMSTR